MIITSIQKLSNNFKSYLQSLNSKINAYAPNSFWDIIAGAIAALFLDLYGSLQLIVNSIFPQNAVGDQVDLWLYREGLPARQGATYTQVTVQLSAGTAVITSGMQFTSTQTGSIYQALQDWTIPDTITQFQLYAIETGGTYVESYGNQLVNGSITCLVQSCQTGQTEETDQSCINRILTAVRSPISGARSTDYAVYCLNYNTTLPSPVVTDSIVIPSFLTVNSVSILGVFPLIGSPMNDYTLDQGLLPATSFVAFSRAADSNTITGVTDYIGSLRLVGLSVIVGPCNTYNVGTINISVACSGTYNLSTPIQIQSQDGNGDPLTITLTIQQLVQRELRRAINNQPFGGTVINGTRYVTIDSLMYAVNNQLAEGIGEIAQVLTNITISGGDITVPPTNTSPSYIQYIYDVSDYTDIVVTLQ